MNTNRKAAIYARYSSDNQRDESIDGQICAIERYAEQHHIDIVATYIDRAKSATTDQRPNFQNMIKDSAKGLFDCIIVHKLDRFSRSKYDSAIYKQKLKINKIKLFSVTENLDGTPESIILESVLEAMAEYYSKNLAREVMKGLCENAKKAMHTGGIPPLGYDVIDKKLVVNEHEAEAVRIIFDRYASGLGYSEIIRELNQKNYQTKKGNVFGKNSVFEILRNEKYCGMLTFNKSIPKTSTGAFNRHAYKDDSDIIRIPGGCPAIVSMELFKEVEKRRLANLQKYGKNKARQKYLLSGLIFCGDCGAPYHANKRSTDSQITYRCSRGNQKLKCNSKDINKNYLENLVLDELKTNIFSYYKVSSIMQMIDDYMEKQASAYSKSISEEVKELEKVRKAQDNILSAIENGYAKHQLKARLDTLLQRENYLEGEIQKTRSITTCNVQRKDIMLLINKFNQMRTENNFDGLRKIVLNFVDRIEISNEKIDVTLKLSFGNADIEQRITTTNRNRARNAV